MDISLTGIETAIASYTKGLDAERAKCAAIARGEIQVRAEQREHAISESQKEITRIQGVLQGLGYALGDIKAQQQGYGERAVVEDFEVVRTH